MFTVSVAVAGEAPVKLTDEGEIEQPMLKAEVLPHVRATVPVKPATGVTEMVVVPDCPGVGMVTPGGLNEMSKSVTLSVTGLDVVDAA